MDIVKSRKAVENASLIFNKHRCYWWGRATDVRCGNRVEQKGRCHRGYGVLCVNRTGAL